jgi:hypothetical protein
MEGGGGGLRPAMRRQRRRRWRRCVEGRQVLAAGVVMGASGRRARLRCVCACVCVCVQGGSLCDGDELARAGAEEAHDDEDVEVGVVRHLQR